MSPPYYFSWKVLSAGDESNRIITRHSYKVNSQYTVHTKQQDDRKLTLKQKYNITVFKTGIHIAKYNEEETETSNYRRLDKMVTCNKLKVCCHL